MAGLIQGISKRIMKREPRPVQTKDGRQFSSLSHDDKLGALFREYRMEDVNGRLQLNRTWFRSALYYQGKQQVQWNPETSSLDYFDPLPGEDWYTENRYRKDVWANIGAMARAEIAPSASPGSDRPDDVAAAKAAQNAIEVIHDDTEHDRNVVLKNLYLCLFGNAFRYQCFIRDKKHGSTITPKYSYQDMQMPGMAVCPQCGMTKEMPSAPPPDCPQCGKPMESAVPPQSVETKVEDGYDEEVNGRNAEIVTGPLEMYMRSKVLHGLGHQPYLFWVRRIDADIVRDARPQAEFDPGEMSVGTDLSQYYIDVLSTLASGPYEGAYRTSGTRFYREVEYAMCWIRPEAFKGDAELKRKYPHGVKFETVNGNYITDTAEDESMDDCWTHYQYIINPYSAWGDGMIDAMPVQDQINEINSLSVRYMRYLTIGKTIYDQDMINPDWLSNNPDESWIPANRQVEKRLPDSVYQIGPGAMAQDVPRWKAALLETMQDMTGAYNAAIGKSSGANVPYSSDVFQAEQAMGRFLPTFNYNRASIIAATRQQLELFRTNTSEERVRKFKDNTGKWSYDKFTGSDLSAGSFDIYISDYENVPRTKAEKTKGMELYANLAPLMPTLSQKQRIYVLDLIGMPPDANPDTLMSQKAYRDIESIVKRNEDVTPNGFILDIPVYVKTIKEYLADQTGDDLASENPQAFVKLFQLMMTALHQGQMQTGAMPPMAPGQGGGPPNGPPPQGPAPPKQEYAQSNQVPQDMKQPIQPLPAGARQQ